MKRPDLHLPHLSLPQLPKIGRTRLEYAYCPPTAWAWDKIGAMTERTNEVADKIETVVPKFAEYRMSAWQRIYKSFDGVAPHFAAAKEATSRPERLEANLRGFGQIAKGLPWALANALTLPLARIASMLVTSVSATVAFGPMLAACAPAVLASAVIAVPYKAAVHAKQIARGDLKFFIKEPEVEAAEPEAAEAEAAEAEAEAPQGPASISAVAATTTPQAAAPEARLTNLPGAPQGRRAAMLAYQPRQVSSAPTARGLE